MLRKGRADPIFLHDRDQPRLPEAGRSRGISALQRAAGRRAGPEREAARAGYLWYFQWRDFPSAIQSIAVSRRLRRVSSVFASVIHSRYSLLWLGRNPS